MCFLWYISNTNLTRRSLETHCIENFIYNKHSFRLYRLISLTLPAKQSIMGIPRFIKLPKHKRFDYSPRYWDPEKEERDERIRRIKQELGIDIPSNSTRTTIKRGSFRQARQKTKVKATRSSNIRLVLILAVLLFLAYLLFFR